MPVQIEGTIESVLGKHYLKQGRTEFDDFSVVTQDYQIGVYVAMYKGGKFYHQTGGSGNSLKYHRDLRKGLDKKGVKWEGTPESLMTPCKLLKESYLKGMVDARFLFDDTYVSVKAKELFVYEGRTLMAGYNLVSAQDLEGNKVFVYIDEGVLFEKETGVLAVSSGLPSPKDFSFFEDAFLGRMSNHEKSLEELINSFCERNNLEDKKQATASCGMVK